MAKRPVLMTREQIEQLIERACDLIDAYHDDAEDDPDNPDHKRERSEVLGAALEALRFAAAAIDYLRDPALVSSLVDVMNNFEGWDLFSDSHDQVLSSAITAVIRAGASAREVRDFASNREAAYRRAVAMGLSAASDEGRELLEELSTDADSNVRNAARENLAEVCEVPWWRGKFSRDPIAGLSPREVRRLKKPLEELAKLLDGQPSEESMARVAKLLDKLPDAVAIDGAERVMRSISPHSNREQPALVVMLSRRGGSEAFLKLLRESWGDSQPSSWLRYRDSSLGPLIAELTDERRDDLARALWDFALTAPHAEGPEILSVWNSAGSLSSVAWPASVDLTPLLDALLAAAEGTEHEGTRGYALRGAAAVFKRSDVSLDAVADRILTARVGGYPGSWALFDNLFDGTIERMPRERVRAFAERALASEEVGTLVWAMSRLLGPSHDPSRDLPQPELAARFYEDPRYRRAMWRDDTLRRSVIPWMRRDFREGTLEFEAAADLIPLIHEFWGGAHPIDTIDVVVPMNVAERRKARRRAAEKSLAKKRAAHAAFLGPEELHGPISELEWERWRLVRDRALDGANGRHSVWRDALEIVPPDPIPPEDRAVIDRAIGAWRAGELDDPLGIAGAIGRCPTASDLAVLDELIRAHEDNRDLLKSARQYARVKLGLPAIPQSEAGAAKKPSAVENADHEWLDDDEDE